MAAATSKSRRFSWGVIRSAVIETTRNGDQFSILRQSVPRVRFLASFRPVAHRYASPIDDLSRLDHLAQFRPFVKVGSFSSYDRTGGNDDGFSGKYSFIRKEGDALVVAELKGPGVITRIWTPTPNDSPLEFLFDGEATPRIVLPFREIFEGTHSPFLAPLAGSGGGGFYSYVPLPFQRSCKIRLHGPKMQFFQINYGLYEPGTKIATIDPADTTAPARYRQDR